MGFLRKPRLKDGGFRRLVPLLLAVSLGVVFLIILLFGTQHEDGLPYSESDEIGTHNYSAVVRDPNLNLPKQTELSISLDKRNHLAPRNLDLFPKLEKDHIKIILYVHNRPQYLQVVVDSLSKMEGIRETLLIVSHDGFFKEMDEIVRGIRFCQVKQLYAPFSPHLFPDSFPGVSVGDCREKGNPPEEKCRGNPDQYGNYRSPRIVSLKHHWWWMMNTIWDGLEETRGQSGHILFIEEDHFIFPNAYRNIQLLSKLKSLKCSDCYAANLAPSDVNSRGEGWDSLVVEKIGNVGYAFNRTVWNIIHSKAKEFCSFDDYNWDITMWATVYPSFGTAVHTLRGPRTSAVHFGKCGLHQGQGKSSACIDNGKANIEVEKRDTIPNINKNWGVEVLTNQRGYQNGFKGWGGWGDERDRELCLAFAKMYHVAQLSDN